MPLKVGVIGAGIIGQLRARSVKSDPATELVGVADPVAAAAERAVAGSGAKAFSDWRQVLDLPGLDAVIISSPIQFHEEQVIAALRAGKHVLCEKPLANTVEACRRILEAAQVAGRSVATGFNHRYYPAIKFLKKVVDDGVIGTVDHLRVFGGHDGLNNFRADWQYKAPISGGGALMDVGIHMTDLTRFILGEVSEVYGVSSNRIWSIPGSEDNALVIMKSPSGVPAVYQATWTEWKGYRFYVEAYGELGMVRGYYAPMFNLLVTQDRPGGRRRRSYKLYPEIIVREKLKTWTSTALQSFQEELTGFRDMIDGRPAALADGFAGLRAVEIAQAIYQSSASGQPVRLARR